MSHQVSKPKTSSSSSSTPTMKTIFFSKCSSRSSVHDHHQHLHHHHHQQQQQHHEKDQNEIKIADHHHGKPTSLTVWRKSLIISCHGFTVINSRGDLVYRVDNYRGRPDELVLMDGSGKSILTMRPRKMLGVIVDSWLVYEGEVGNCSAATCRPVWCVKKHGNILQPNHQNVLAYVFPGRYDRRHSFVIEGSYTNRSCKVLDGSRKAVAEIKRKEAIAGGVSYGVEVFVLSVESGFDPGFAMGLVLILDQMFS